MKMNARRWVISPSLPADCLGALHGIPIATAQLAYNRGITSLAALRSFLVPGKSQLSDHRLLPDIGPAIERLTRAIEARELIALYGDFDADGVTASALLYEGLSSLGARSTPYIPHRTEEGHGLSIRGLESLKGLGASLVLTADCGISSASEVDAASAMGMDVIITDHHSPPPRVPAALAVIDPKRVDSEYPYQHLAAVGVAYKLIQALRESLGKAEDEGLLDLVALGSVADLAPLDGENRYLVKKGIEALNGNARPGIREMATVAGISLDSIDTEAISYGLAPRLNAAGRVDHAITSYRLLTATSPAEARPLAQELELRNRERRSQTEEVLGKVREQVAEFQPGLPILIVGDESYQPGVVGLAASKLVEEFWRPAIVLALGREISRASARSIPEFDIIAALRRCDELFLRYGGHSMAAGFVIASENVEPLKDRLLAIAGEELGGMDLQPHISVDVELPLRDVEGRLIKFVALLEPSGQGNPRPVFLSRGVEVLDVRELGSEGKHLRLKLREGPVTWGAVAFGLGQRARELGSSIDIVYHLKEDRWQGRERLELELIDFAPSGPR